MHKLKLSLLAIAVMVGIGGAFATKFHGKSCNPVYYKDHNGVMQPLSGVTQWTCDTDPSSTCDYDSNHLPCDKGDFRIITP
jgi:hypothetical protein